MTGKRKNNPTKKPTKKPKKEPENEISEEILLEEDEDDFVTDVNVFLNTKKLKKPAPKLKIKSNLETETVDQDDDIVLFGDPIQAYEALQKWPHRYQQITAQGKMKGNIGCSSTASEDSSEELVQAVCHYTTAKDGEIMFNVGDDAHVQAEKGEEDYICRILEIFKGTDGLSYFRAQWYYRAKDTGMKKCGNQIDNKRVFISEIKDDNPLGCLVKKLNIIRLPLDMEDSKLKTATSDCDFYYNMKYLLDHSTFIKLPILADDVTAGNESDSTISNEVDATSTNENKSNSEDVNIKTQMSLLDLYAGCGGMSTGLTLGANAAGVNLTTKWAVDFNEFACQSLRYNHPETNVRNETAEDFLGLLKEWGGLIAKYVRDENEKTPADSMEEDEEEDDDGSEDGDDGEVFEVEEILDICFGKRGKKQPVLHFKIKWKNYGPEYDTWEPIDCLDGCPDKLKEYVVNGYNSKLLPLPGDVDIICGGPPCQGISGFNRYRKKDEPLKDEKNKQLLVYMDIIEYLKPKYVLMENVVDLLKFSDGFLGRYACARLISMNYQTRLGMMAAGSYGLPQFRLRVFLWGACPSENLPQYPLPTSDCVYRGVIPTEFNLCYVRHIPGTVELERKLFLEDAISDLPPVENEERRDEIPYDGEPITDFQKFIRSTETGGSNPVLFDHRPYKMNYDDYQRACQIPKKKGANFRNLKGVIVVEKNTAKLDPDVPREYLPSGKPLVPDYAISFIKGTSSKPFGRVWWDETVPTVVTRPEPHNQVILHPVQDRVLTIRENARLQGFPDWYKLFGPVKERYIQVGNAVAVPVSRALGYSLGLAIRGIWSEAPVFALPKKFPNISEAESPIIDDIVLS